MLLEFEPIAAVRAFMERGGDVLTLIAAVTFLMWTLMLERLWYFKILQPREAKRVEETWRARSDHDTTRLARSRPWLRCVQCWVCLGP